MVIDYNKVPEGTLNGVLDFKEKVQSMKDFIESTQYSLNWYHLNSYMDEEETIKLLDCIDFEKSKMHIDVDLDNIDLNNKQTQKILQTQEMIAGYYEGSSLFSEKYIQKTKEIIKSSKHFNIMVTREEIQHFFDMLRDNEISNVKVDIIGGNNTEELKFIMEVMKENEDILVQNNIKLNKCAYENCDTIEEVDEETLYSMFSYFSEGTVLIGNKENPYEQPMNHDTYQAVREKLNDIVRDIPQDLPRKDKFKIIYTRIAEKISYDYKAIEKDTDYKEKVKNTSRNLIGGLLQGECICAGYAEVLKQACSLVGIPCRYVPSEGKEGEGSHAYNVVEYELGKWANADITLDYKNIRDERKVKYALKSDKDFRKEVKEFHSPESYEELRKLFNGAIPEKPEIPKCLKSIELYPEYNLPKPIRRLKNMIKKINPKNIFKLISKEKILQLSNQSEVSPIGDGDTSQNVKEEKDYPEERPKMKSKSEFTEYLSNMENFDQSTNRNEKLNESISSKVASKGNRLESERDKGI